MEKQPEDSLSADPDSSMMNSKDLSAPPATPHEGQFKRRTTVATNGKSSFVPPVRTGLSGRIIFGIVRNSVTGTVRNMHNVDRVNRFASTTVSEAVTKEVAMG